MITAITLEAGGTRVVVDIVGARVASLRDPHGHEWLHPGRGLGSALGADDFALGAQGGWDDCFPSVSASSAPIASADHGELWAQRWTAQERTASSVTMTLCPSGSGWEATRTITVANDGHVTSALRITGSAPLAYLYSAHPMLVWRTGAEVVVPGAGLAALGGFGADDVVSWQESEGGVRCEITDAGASACVKRFVRWNGRADVTADGHRLIVEADPAVLPWVGVCINRDDWPGPENRQRWVAVEPATHAADEIVDLADAATLTSGEAAVYAVSFRFPATVH